MKDRCRDTIVASRHLRRSVPFLRQNIEGHNARIGSLDKRHIAVHTAKSAFVQLRRQIKDAGELGGNEFLNEFIDCTGICTVAVVTAADKDLFAHSEEHIPEFAVCAGHFSGFGPCRTTVGNADDKFTFGFRLGVGHDRKLCSVGAFEL